MPDWLAAMGGLAIIAAIAAFYHLIVMVWCGLFFPKPKDLLSALAFLVGVTGISVVAFSTFVNYNPLHSSLSMLPVFLVWSAVFINTDFSKFRDS